MQQKSRASPPLIERPGAGANKLKSFIEEWEEEQHEDCMAMARPLKKAKVAWPRAKLWQ